MTTTDTATQAALAIVNTVKANPAIHFDAKNATVVNMAAIIRAAYTPEQQRYAALIALVREIYNDLESGFIANDGMRASRNRNKLQAHCEAVLNEYDLDHPAPALDPDTQAEGRQLGDD